MKEQEKPTLDHLSLQSALQIKSAQSYKIIKDFKHLNSLQAILLARKFKGHYRTPLNLDLNDKKGFLHLYEIEEQHILFWKNLNQLLEIYNMDLRRLSDILNLSQAKLKLRYARGISPHIDHALLISDYFKISLPLFYGHQIDFNCVKKNRNYKINNHSYLPDRFTIQAGSKMRTFNHAFHYAKKELGDKIMQEILGSMQIHPKTLTFPETKINLELFNQFHKKVRSFEKDDLFFIQMGISNNKDKKNKAQFSQCKNIKCVQDVYTIGVKKLISNIDKNYDYHIEIIDKHNLVITSNPKNNIKVGSFEVMLYRFGHFIGCPAYFDFPESNLKLSTYEYDEENDGAIFKISH